MKRYFDLLDEKQTLMIEVKAGSGAALASPEAIAKHFSCRGAIREIESAEYSHLTKKYTEIGSTEEAPTTLEGKEG